MRPGLLYTFGNAPPPVPGRRRNPVRRDRELRRDGDRPRMTPVDSRKNQPSPIPLSPLPRHHSSSARSETLPLIAENHPTQELPIPAGHALGATRDLLL